MKRIISLLLCFAMAASLFGCAGEQEYTPTGDALVIEGETVAPTEEEAAPKQYLELAYYPDSSLNPYQSTNYTNRVLFSLLYQGLFATDRNYKSTPVLCGRYTMTEDMRRYTFYPADATFSDGTKVTVEDIYASLDAAIKGPVYGSRFTHVAEMALSDDGGIIFALSVAMENLPILLDVPIVKAEEVTSARPTGTGPYYYENAAGGLRLRRRGDWWCTSPDLIVTANSIPLQEVESVLKLRDAFEFSNVGLACADPCSDAYVDYRCDYELWDCDNGNFLYLGCNMLSKVFSNAKIRAALTYAIDRQTIAETYYRGFGLPATLPASPASPYYNKQLAERYDYDLERFSQVISDEYMLGATIKFLVNKEDSLRLRVARDIAQTLRDCGLVVEMLEFSTKGYTETLTYGMYDLYLGQTCLSPNMDLSQFFRYYGTLRYGNVPDNNILALCQQALANSGNYYNLHETVADDGRICPILFHNYSIHATRGLLTGLNPSRDNVFYYTLGKTMEDVRQVIE